MFPPFLWEKVAVFPPKKREKRRNNSEAGAKRNFLLSLLQPKKEGERDSSQEIILCNSSASLGWTENPNRDVCWCPHTHAPSPTYIICHPRKKKKIPLRPPYRAKNRVIRSFSQKSKKNWRWELSLSIFFNFGSNGKSKHFLIVIFSASFLGGLVTRIKFVLYYCTTSILPL